MIKRKQLTKEQAIQKIKHYCGYQQRCHIEVKEKLYSMGIWKQNVEEIISQLIEENYLSEERFAQDFARGKFRMNQWGRIKITYELRQKRVSDYCISKAMAEITDEEYQKTLEKLATTKWATLEGEENVFARKKKLLDYLMQKGFEFAHSKGVLEQLTEK